MQRLYLYTIDDVTQTYTKTRNEITQVYITRNTQLYCTCDLQTVIIFKNTISNYTTYICHIVKLLIVHIFVIVYKHYISRIITLIPRNTLKYLHISLLINIISFKTVTGSVTFVTAVIIQLRLVFSR